MAVALEGVAPTKAVFSYGLMRDENGEEMHKSKGNSIPFEDAADKMGADVMRWVFARHIPQNNLNFGYSVGDAARRRFVIPLWNIYYFLTTYARLDGWTAEHRRLGELAHRTRVRSHRDLRRTPLQLVRQTLATSLLEVGGRQ